MQTQRWWWALMIGVLFAGTACDDKAPEGPLESEGEPSLSWHSSAERVEGSPISLTASDGSGLVLTKLTARAVIDEPLAFTELHLTFENPESHQREGRFAITLPSTAAISRFAMRVGGAWQEGEVVERARARAVYEDYLHRKQDPALLEQDAGNQFTARVFPIGPNEAKEIIVSYSEELPRSDEPYRILLKGLPSLGELDVDVLFGSHSDTGLQSSERARGKAQRLTMRERNHVPSGNLSVALPRGRVQPALRSGELVVARVAASSEGAAEPLDGLTVLFDTSASRALGFEAQVERLSALLSTLHERVGVDFPLQIIAFDQTQEPIYAGPVSAFSGRDKARLLARDALGASDLSAALGSLAAQKPASRVLVVSDGVVTAGASDTTVMREAVAKLAAHGVRRVDALAEGGIRDESVLSALTRSGLKSTGVVLDARLQVAGLADRLLRTTRERVEVSVPGADFVHPRVLEGVQPGDEFLIFARLPAETALKIELAGQPSQTPSVTEAPRPLLERAHARVEIARLESELHGLGAQDEEARTRVAREIVTLSTRQRVLSELTALLVLENAYEYSRFGLDPAALANILRVHEGGLELFDRRGQAPLELAEGSTEGHTRAAPEAPTSMASQRDEPSADSERKGESVAVSRSRPAFAPAPEPSAPMAEPSLASRSTRASEQPRARAEAAADLGSLDDVGIGVAVAGRVTSHQGSGAAARPSEQESLPGAYVLGPALEPRAVARLHTASGLEEALAAGVVRQKLAAVARSCYARAATRSESPEQVNLEFSLTERGTVSSVFVSGGRMLDGRAQSCIVDGAHRLQFPKPTAGNASVSAGVQLSMAPSVARPSSPGSAPVRRTPPKLSHPTIREAYDGVLADTLEAIQGGDLSRARTLAEAAHGTQPGDVIGLIALGEALEAQGDFARAARAYGSLIDLFPSRTDLRRMAGARLERLPHEHGLALAADSYEKALAQRPDHPSSYRLLGYAQLKQELHARAFSTLTRAIERGFRPDRFQGVDRILREDLGLVAAAFVRARPDQAEHVTAELARLGVARETKPSLRFVLNWETDANDVDFHIHDGRGGHAFYLQPKLGSGGSLYADITSGYGPECFAIAGAGRAYPYVLQAHYFARGPMGYGMGKLQVIEHDGQGNLRFTERPFTIMKDRAFVELAVLEAPKRS